MGPIALFDKSFLQSLSVDESVWFEHFFCPTICPLFYVETLADLTKLSLPDGRSPESEVKNLASKAPMASGYPCTHHRELCIANLMGHEVPMNGQVPISGGKSVRSLEGKRGVVYDESPEAKAFSRWQRGEFKEIESQIALDWRRMLSTLDLKGTAQGMRALGIDAKSCKSVEQAHAWARQIVHSNSKPFDQMALLFEFVGAMPEQKRQIFEHCPLISYAPYAAHVMTVELFFQIALAAHIISTDRPSNRVDIAYLFYLPFCMVFVSGDKLHRKCALPFLRRNQEFVWSPDLKADLARLNMLFEAYPQEEIEKGIMKFAPIPIGNDEDLVCGLWTKHLPGWRIREETQIQLSDDAQKKVTRDYKHLTGGGSYSVPGGHDGGEIDEMAIQRMVPKRKGNWYLLPKDLKIETEGGAEQAAD